MKHISQFVFSGGSQSFFLFLVPVIPNFLFQQEHPEDYQRVRGELNTPGEIRLCEEIQFNTTYKLDKLTNNGTAFNESMKCK